MQIFRKLTTTEQQEFVQWARDNYTPLTDIQGVWHPIIQAECVRMNEKSVAVVTTCYLCNKTLPDGGVRCSECGKLTCNDCGDGECCVKCYGPPDVDDSAPCIHCGLRISGAEYALNEGWCVECYADSTPLDEKKGD